MCQCDETLFYRIVLNKIDNKNQRVWEVNSTSQVCSHSICKVLLPAFDPSGSYNVTITAVNVVGESENATYTDIIGKLLYHILHAWVCLQMSYMFTQCPYVATVVSNT